MTDSGLSLVNDKCKFKIMYSESMASAAILQETHTHKINHPIVIEEGKNIPSTSR